MKWLTLVAGLSVGTLSCTTSQVVPARNIIVNSPNGAAAANQTANYPVTIFLLERDIPPLIKRLGVVRISTATGSMYIDSVVKRELQKKCQALGANGAYRLSEGYYPGNTLDIPYLVFSYDR